MTEQQTGKDFRVALPRLFELRDLHPNPTHPDAYFQNFETTLENPHAFSQFRDLEQALQSLDEAGWESVKRRAIPYLVAPKRSADGRGWQQLFDVFNEARAYRYLKEDGCADIQFIEPGNTRKPDLQALKSGALVYCEVKTLNVSKDEADRRVEISEKGVAASSVAISLSSGFLNKVSSTFQSAVAQLDGVDPQRSATRLIFVVVHFDDWVGDYMPQYFAQLDAYLAANPVEAQVVVHPASNLFERVFTMQNALVV